MMTHLLVPVHPLIMVPSGDPDLDAMRSSFDALCAEEREAISTYLRAGAMVVAWMEYTHDQIGDRFGVPGGSAVMSDGHYFWRLDGADYVKTYGIALPPEFLDDCRRQNWRAPQLSLSQIDELDLRISQHFRQSRRNARQVS